MWCERDGNVLGIKNTHRVRNTGALLGSVALPGAFLLGKVEGYYCPKCGAKVHPIRDRHDPIGQESIEPHDEAYWIDYVARVSGDPTPPPV